MPEVRTVTVTGTLLAGTSREAAPFRPYVYRGSQPHDGQVNEVKPFMRNRTLKPCGTDAAYHRHVVRNEDPCAPCRKAHQDNCSKSAAARKANEAIRRRKQEAGTYTAHAGNTSVHSRAPKPCGTDAAYHRHQRKKEDIDNACREAHNKHCSSADRKRARRAAEKEQRMLEKMMEMEMGDRNAP